MTTSSELSAIQKAFLNSPTVAVVGASKEYGTNVLNWYKSRSLNVIPIHPTEKELEGLETLRSIAELPCPKETSISIITPPKVTLEILEQAKDLSIPFLRLQPGAEYQSVVEYIKDNGLSDHVILGSPGILVGGRGVRLH